MIKIIFFIDSYRVGGMHKQILYLLENLNKDTFQPIICVSSSKGNLKNEFEKTNCQTIDLKWKRSYDLSVGFRLVKVLYKERPDIFMITEPQNFLYYRFARLFYLYKIINVGSFRALTFWNGHLSKKHMILDKFISRLFYKTSDKIIVNSMAMKMRYEQVINVSKNKPIQVIYNGCDFNFQINKSSDSIKKELNISLGDFVIIMTARLDPWKDFETILEAIRLVSLEEKNIKLVLVGEGQLRRKITEMISKKNIQDFVIMAGEKLDIHNYVNMADISVLSTNGEGFSNSILESMYLEKAVIATNVGGNTELLHVDNKYGILSDPKSPTHLSKCILILKRDLDLRSKITDSAKKRIIELCNIKHFISEYENCFKNLVE
tara:strand:- start:4590 stop:5720 length:1131 start_codon:yes stop_codon:yes gene_type:complete